METAVVKMYAKRKLKKTYKNSNVREFLQPQNKSVKTAVKISVSTARIENRATGSMKPGTAAAGKAPD